MLLHAFDGSLYSNSNDAKSDSLSDANSEALPATVRDNLLVALANILLDPQVHYTHITIPTRHIVLVFIACACSLRFDEGKLCEILLQQLGEDGKAKLARQLTGIMEQLTDNDVRTAALTALQFVPVPN